MEAAGNRFDEIQFDYIRFPDAIGVAYSTPTRNRAAWSSEFLREARRRLAPLNVFLAADVFGYVAWNLNDSEIGQQIKISRPSSITCAQCSIRPEFTMEYRVT